MRPKPNGFNCRDSPIAEAEQKRADSCGYGLAGHAVLGLTEVFIGRKAMRIAKKILKKMLLFAVVFDILMILFEYRTIECGAFSLGIRTSEIVYARTPFTDMK